MIRKFTPSKSPARKRRSPASQMPKIQVNITRPQEEFLNTESERLDITIADLVRRIIDTYREGRK